MAAFVKDWAGPDTLLARLEQDIRQGAPGRCYLLCGPAGSGKRTLAECVAAALLCDQPTPWGCGHCRQCRRAAAGNHPNLKVLLPADGRKSIGVDPVRQLIEDLSQRAYEGRRRVVLLPQIDTATPQAQNMLLKTLEEAPADTCFVLTAEALPRVLVTIRSRCVLLRMPAVPAAQIEDWLVAHGTPRQQAAAAAALADGCVGRALQVIDQQADQSAAQAVEMLGKIIDGKMAFPQAANWLTEQKKQLPQVLDAWERALCAALPVAAAGGAQNPTQPGMGMLPQAGALPPNRVTAMLGAVLQARQAVVQNASGPAVTDRLLLALYPPTPPAVTCGRKKIVF